ncbi:MAG: response regulator [Ectothiorhodospiraceae bacterium]|nr:response regulator [Chromatiales bacterium]MCP5154449.1 response regulator [Ectothiorhodospiraceae bacterium]
MPGENRPYPGGVPLRAHAPRSRAVERPHIVVVDDEVEIRDMLQEYLELNGLRVTCAESGQALRAVVSEDPPDLAVLDITMPGEDGLSIARYLREHTRIGIVMLTASGATVDRIIGLEMGADDYLAKPVDLRELLARIKAVLRRARASGAGGPETTAPATTVVSFGRCRLDLDAHKLFAADGEEIPVTAMEFDMLKAFAEHPNRVLSRDQLLDLAHNRDWEPFDRSIDIRISRLRKKVELDPTKPQVIKTVRGAGYLFSPQGG